LAIESICGQRSDSDIFEDISESKKFMNPTTGNAIIGIALMIVFLPHLPVPMEAVLIFCS
jgi:hypothetical protein